MSDFVQINIINVRNADNRSMRAKTSHLSSMTSGQICSYIGRGAEGSRIYLNLLRRTHACRVRILSEHSTHGLDTFSNNIGLTISESSLVVDWSFPQVKTWSFSEGFEMVISGRSRESTENLGSDTVGFFTLFPMRRILKIKYNIENMSLTTNLLGFCLVIVQQGGAW
jgi:hypothetical protein